MNTKKLAQPLTLEEIQQSFVEQTVISGQIISANPYQKIFKVLIGRNKDRSPIFGTLSFDDYSIQHFRLLEADTSNPSNFILGKDAYFSIGNWIKCYIISMNNNNIYLSRKETQLITFQNLQIGQEVNCKVTTLNHPYTFVDIGNGIIALAPINELSLTRYTDVKNWFNIGDKFSAIITNITPDKKICVSRKAYIEKTTYNKKILPEEIIPCRISNKLDGGYFVEITPLISGIMDTEEILDEGSYVLGYVKKVKELKNGKIGYQLCLYGLL